MNRKLLVGRFLASTASVGHRKIVVRRGILWLELDRRLQRRHSLRKLPLGHQRRAQPEESVPEAGVEFSGTRKMLDRFIPLLRLPRQLAQDILSPGIVGVNLKLLLEFLLGILGNSRRWIGLGEQQAPQAKVDARLSRVLLQDGLILPGRLIPLASYFERFSLELASLRGTRCGRRELLCSAGGEIRIGMNRNVQHFWITREFAVEQMEKIEGHSRLVKNHRTAYPSEPRTAPQIFICKP